MKFPIEFMNLPISKMKTFLDTSLSNISGELLEDIKNIKENPITINVKYIIHQDILLTKGLNIKIKHKGNFQCNSCSKIVKKLFEGFCFPCFKKKAAADRCIMSPNLCHYNLGTCREPSWGDQFCYQPHYVYLSFTDKFKVGITRHSQIPTRWIDQGATAAALLCKVTSRHQAGVIEHILKEILHDKSHWLNMLKNANKRPSANEFQEKVNFIFQWIQNNPVFKNNDFLVETPAHLNLNKNIEFFNKPIILNLNFETPNENLKFKSINLDKSPEINGTITGIKGQYIFLEEFVFNMRRHEGYMVDFEIKSSS